MSTLNVLCEFTVCLPVCGIRFLVILQPVCNMLLHARACLACCCSAVQKFSRALLVLLKHFVLGSCLLYAGWLLLMSVGCLLLSTFHLLLRCVRRWDGLIRCFLLSFCLDRLCVVLCLRPMCYVPKSVLLGLMLPLLILVRGLMSWRAVSAVVAVATLALLMRWMQLCSLNPLLRRGQPPSTG